MKKFSKVIPFSAFLYIFIVMFYNLFFFFDFLSPALHLTASQTELTVFGYRMQKSEYLVCNSERKCSTNSGSDFNSFY